VRDEFTVALVIPRSGPAGIFGLSCELSAMLAAEELNAADGTGGREIRLLPVDGGSQPSGVAAETDRLISTGTVDAVLGWHISAVRQALVPSVACRVPYVYTAQYEGGERSPGVFVTGETPASQLFPAMRLLGEARGVRSWYIVGNDYVWPRQTAAAARGYAGRCGARIAGEAFVPLGTRDFAGALRGAERSGADAVLELLVGQDAVAFNRAFGARRLHETTLRLSTLMDENMLLGSGANATRDLWVSGGYFETLATPESLGFGARYARRFGAEAPPVGGPGESCYEGMRLLAALTRCQRNPNLAGAATDVASAAAGIAGYEGGRGTLRLRGNHVEQPVYLARADGLEFDVVARL
jgi:ABC-type branched-subunit amino acid transport system substrate-binding protein